MKHVPAGDMLPDHRNEKCNMRRIIVIIIIAVIHSAGISGRCVRSLPHKFCDCRGCFATVASCKANVLKSHAKQADVQ